METLLNGLAWATGSLEGIAFVEYLILVALIFLWREIRLTNKRLTEHETGCATRETTNQTRLADGSTKMAVLDERTLRIQEDIRDIKAGMKA